MTRNPAIAATGLGTGLLLIIAWFAVSRTTLLLAYGHNGSHLSLSQAQGLCDSSLGLLARSFSAQGAAKCGSIDSVSMWLNIAGFIGVLLLIGGAALLIYQRTRPQPPPPYGVIP